jgi:hypothetical protein
MVGEATPLSAWLFPASTRRSDCRRRPMCRRKPRSDRGRQWSTDLPPHARAVARESCRNHAGYHRRQAVWRFARTPA